MVLLRGQHNGEILIPAAICTVDKTFIRYAVLSRTESLYRSLCDKYLDETCCGTLGPEGDWGLYSCQGHSNSRKMVFNVKKAAKRWHGLDAIAKRTKREVMWVLRIFVTKSQFLLANKSTPMFTKSLWDSMWSPEAGGRFLTENTSLAYSAPAYTTQQLLAEFWILSDWSP